MKYVGSYVNELGNIIDCYEINGYIEHLPRTEQFYKPIYFIYPPNNVVPVQPPPPPINPPPPPVYMATGLTPLLVPTFNTTASSVTRSSHLDKNTYTQKLTNINNPDSNQIYQKYEVQNNFKNKLVDKLNIGKIAHEMKIKRYELDSYFKF